MNIHEILYRIKARTGRVEKVEVFKLSETGEVEKYPFLRKFYLSLVIILVALASFGLGRLSSVSNQLPIEIRYEDFDKAGISAKPATEEPKVLGASTKNESGEVTASSRGTKYYPRGCKNTISAKNKITFSSAQEAEKAGYSLASACK